MKLWLALLAIGGCATSFAEEAPPAAPAAAPVASCADGTPYDAAIMRERVGMLASVELDGRAPGSDGDLATRAFLVEQFRCLNLAPAFDDGYEQPFTDQGDATANVVGYLRGTGDDVILVGAHHDHLGGGYLGANDNASGVVALLAIAQDLAQRYRSSPPARTIAFAAFGAEERGMRGSYHYARHPSAALPGDHVVQFINLDMVGSHSSRGLVTAMGTWKGMASTKLLPPLAKAFPKLRVAMGGVSRGSDFEPFCKQGVPYVFFWTPDARCYHGTCDTAKRLDYARMVDIAALAGDLTHALAETELDLAGLRARLGCRRR